MSKLPVSSTRWLASRRQVAALVFTGMACPIVIAQGPAGDAQGAVDDIDWRRIEAQATAEVDARIVAGDSPVLTKGILDSHGMVRTGQLTGDFSDLPPQSAEFGPEFGFSVAISGEWLVVGAPGTVTSVGGNTREHGALFVFRREGGGWIQKQILTRPGLGSQRCGHSVALRLPHLVTGCPDLETAASVQRGVIHKWSLNDDEDGFVYRSSRFFDTTEAHCGRALSLTRNYLAVSCPTANEDAGRVYVQKRNPLTDEFEGESEVEFNGSSVPDMDVFNFGEALAMYEPAVLGIGPQNVRLAIGAPNTIYPGNSFPRGTVHLYHRAVNDADWNANAIFRPSPTGTDGSTFAQFGAALAMNWNQLVVGAPNNRHGAIDTLPGPGSAHRYELHNIVGSIYEWQTRENGGGTNVPDGPHAEMRFGAALAIAHANLTAIGAPGTDGEENDGDPAEAVGLVEFRRSASGGWNVFNYQGHARPGPINPLLVRDAGQFGRSLDSDTGNRRLAAGYPRSGGTLGMPGEPNRPRGSVWIYESDEIFADGFQ
jgi:hypothetical protein